jgi:hypothetical protein
LVYGSWLSVAARVLENDSTSDNKNDSSIDKSDGISGESRGKRSKKTESDDGYLTDSFLIDLGSDKSNARR